MGKKERRRGENKVGVRFGGKWKKIGLLGIYRDEVTWDTGKIKHIHVASALQSNRRLYLIFFSFLILPMRTK